MANTRKTKAAAKSASTRKKSAPVAVSEVAAEPITETMPDTPASAEKKTPGRKPAPKVRLFVEYQGKQVSQDDIIAAIKADCSATVKTVDVYVKPEDSAVYYVANGDTEGKIAF